MSKHIKIMGMTKYFDMEPLSQGSSRRASCCSPNWKKRNQIMWNDRSLIKVIDYFVINERGLENFITNELREAIDFYKSLLLKKSLH